MLASIIPRPLHLDRSSGGGVKGRQSITGGHVPVRKSAVFRPSPAIIVIPEAMKKDQNNVGFLQKLGRQSSQAERRRPANSKDSAVCYPETRWLLSSLSINLFRHQHFVPQPRFTWCLYDAYALLLQVSYI